MLVRGDGAVIGGRWRVIQALGEGAFGQVHEVADTSEIGIGSAAAKILHSDLAPRDRRAFLAEAKKMATLHHPNLVGYLDSGHDEIDGASRPYLVTELCDHSLADRLAGGPLPTDEVLALVADVAAGLGHLHRRGHLHRDVKASNVLASANGWKVADFGLMRDLTATGTYYRQDQLMGTPAFMAPELFSETTATAASDVYALGVLAHLAATGRPLHRGSGQALIQQIVHSRPEIDPALSPDIRAIVEWTTRRDPTERPTAAELGEWIDEGASWNTVALPIEPAVAAPVIDGFAPAPGGFPATRRFDAASAGADTGEVAWGAAAGRRPQRDGDARPPWSVLLLSGLAGLIGAAIALGAYQLGTRAGGDDGRLAAPTTTVPTSTTDAPPDASTTTSTSTTTTTTSEPVQPFASLNTPGDGPPSRIEEIDLDRPREVKGEIDDELESHLFTFEVADDGGELAVAIEELSGGCDFGSIWDVRVAVVDTTGQIVAGPVQDLVCGTAIGPWALPGPGMYGLVVSGGPGDFFRQSTGSYELTVGRLDRSEVPVNLRRDRKVSGEIDAPLDSESFVFPSQGGEVLTVSVEGLNDGDCGFEDLWAIQLELIGPSGAPVGQPVVDVTCRTEQRWRLDVPGDYRLIVSGGGGGLFRPPTGSFELELELEVA